MAAAGIEVRQRGENCAAPAMRGRRSACPGVISVACEASSRAVGNGASRESDRPFSTLKIKAMMEALAAKAFAMIEPRDFDILSPGFHANPFPTLDRMRAEGPVVRMKLPIVGRTWLAVTHDACATLLKDHETFARDPANAGSRTQARILRFLPRTISLLALNMLGHDDPEHRRLRGLVDQAFQRRTIEAMKPMITEIADRLLDRLEGRTEADLMSEFCRDLPLSVICAMLGLPEQDHDRFKNWLGGLKDTANIGAVIRAIPGVIRVVRYLRRVSRPGGGALPDGLIAALRDAETDGQKLSEDELVSMIFLLFGAGQETTTHLISGGLFALLSQEDQLPSAAERTKPDADLRRRMSALRIASADDQAALCDPRRGLAGKAIPPRRHARWSPGGGKLRSCQIRAPSQFRHHAPPEPAPFLRHRRAFLPWLPTRSGGGRDRVRTHPRAFSKYAPRHHGAGRSSGASALASAPSHSCLYDSWHEVGVRVLLKLHLSRPWQKARHQSRAAAT